jgi:hypothetical protein
MLYPPLSDTVGQVKEQVAAALGVFRTVVVLQDDTGRRLNKNDATLEQYAAKLPLTGFKPPMLPGGMPGGVCSFVGLCVRDLCLCLYL